MAVESSKVRLRRQDHIDRVRFSSNPPTKAGKSAATISESVRFVKLARRTLEELRQTAIDLDVHLLACKMSMDVLEIGRDDLIPEVENVVGVATFVKEAAGAKLQLFI